MKLLRFSGKKHTSRLVNFTGPGEMKIGEWLTLKQAEAYVKDFPDQFSIIDTSSKAYKDEQKAKDEEAKKAAEALEAASKSDDGADDQAGSGDDGADSTKDVQPTVTGDMNPDVTK